MTEAADVKCPDASPVGDVDTLDTSTVSYCGTKVAVAQPASSEPHAAGDTEVAGASSSEPHAADDTEVPVAQPASSEQHAADDSSDEDEGEPREFTAKILFKGKVYTLQYTRQTQVKELKTMLQERSGSKVPIKVRYRVGNKFIYAGDALQLTEVMIHEVKVTENHISAGRSPGTAPRETYDEGGYRELWSRITRLPRPCAKLPTPWSRTMACWRSRTTPLATFPRSI